MKPSTLTRGSTRLQSKIRRDWRAAAAKVRAESRCRLHEEGGCSGKRDIAHVIGRSCDERILNPEPGGFTHRVHRDAVVRLCRHHHRLYDEGQVDLEPFLNDAERRRATRDAGGRALALRRTAPVAWRGDQL